MILPTKEECLALLKEYKVPSNIVAHTKVVTKIAVFLSEKLKEKGIKINKELVERSAMLHDLDKIITLKDLRQHGFLTKKILTEKGYPEVGKVIEFHGLLEHIGSWEEKVLIYADRRVNHEDIVSVDERYDGLLERYSSSFPKQEIESGREIVKSIEKEIFKNLDFKPEDLKNKLEKGN